eukprot:CAMPEP_0195623164 /NCGR_PEP_ID=MMETSP0815-20121206/16608_1 /TAXON_ID=97485 /ORGANISM="Prymnesium parvum, Strain Texoma1" /LENGTH=36 /DNA_ID= /DNA_START= /DNA_END= /DNA_ORIENTATION=
MTLRLAGRHWTESLATQMCSGRAESRTPTTPGHAHG